MHRLKMLPNGLAVLDGGDCISDWVEERGLCLDYGMIRDWILPRIKPGDWVMDAGASLGDHTRTYLDTVGPSGKVFAFEPNPEYFKCLKINCPEAVSSQGILWNERTSLYLHIPDLNVGGAHVSVSDSGGPGGEVVGPIETVVLDDLNLERLNFAKFDLEGAEYFALLGMEKTIQRCRPSMVLEMIPGPAARFGLNHMHVYDLLDKWNYSHRSIRGSPGDYCSNCDILAEPR